MPFTLDEVTKSGLQIAARAAIQVSSTRACPRLLGVAIVPELGTFLLVSGGLAALALNQPCGSARASSRAPQAPWRFVSWSDGMDSLHNLRGIKVPKLPC